MQYGILQLYFYFSGPGKAISLVFVSLCVSEQ